MRVAVVGYDAGGLVASRLRSVGLAPASVHEADMLLLLLPTAREVVAVLTDLAARGRRVTAVDFCVTSAAGSRAVRATDHVLLEADLRGSGWDGHVVVGCDDALFKHIGGVLTAVAPFARNNAKGIQWRREADSRQSLVPRLEGGATVPLHPIDEGWLDQMRGQIASAPFLLRHWLTMRVETFAPSGRAPFGYMCVTWLLLERRILDGDELRTYRLPRAAGVALVRDGQIVDDVATVVMD